MQEKKGELTCACSIKKKIPGVAVERLALIFAALQGEEGGGKRESLSVGGKKGKTRENMGEGKNLYLLYRGHFKTKCKTKGNRELS